MANIAEYLDQLQTLTQKNLEILQAINNSFFTKREHLTVSVGDTEYVIPSFISLENKINALQENFSNLVYAPKTGEATFNFDGNSRSIEVKGYTCTPDRLNLDLPEGFSHEQNDILKDMLTPNPFIKFSLQSLPNDITHVVVRKVAIKGDALKSLIGESVKTDAIIKQEWSDLWKILSVYTEDIDYVMYDTIRRLPIHENIGSGVYTIKSIDKDIVDDNLDEYISLTFAEDLKYKLFDETVEKYLAVGDQLVTYDDNAKMEIVSVNPAARQLTVKVLNGDYLNLVADSGDESKVSDLSKLKFFSPVDFDKDKYIKVPLEEDQYIGIFIAGLNSRMNIQAPWGCGVLVNTDIITDEDDTTFKTYYEENVRNVGDVLYEITSIMSNTIMKYSRDEFNRFSGYKPYVDPNNLQVLQINTHLNNSKTVKNIRALYSQKQEYIAELNELQSKIADINKTLAEISFVDTTGIRDSYLSQLSQYNARRNELNTSITRIMHEIATSANDSVVPLENAKYHIRGYYKWNVSAEEDATLAEFKKHIHGIKVQYRYKTVDGSTGTAATIGDSFIFSDWNDMPSFILQKVPSFKDGYTFGYPEYDNGTDNKTQDNSGMNEPSFNQIDIPISQGETVDIRLKIVWDFGYPFIESTSDWSEITNIAFPDELLKDVQVLDIVKENNNDIENNRFRNILKEEGVIDHIGDKVVDQDVVFFHKPENISSGFYTAERRIIPLRDKLQSIDASIKNLDAMVNGASSENLQVSIIIDGMETVIKPDQKNTISLPAYLDTAAGENKIIYNTIATIQIANTSAFTSYLYSMFPGSRETTINNLKSTKYDKGDYCNSSEGVWLAYPSYDGGSGSIGVTGTDWILQRANQWLTFRVRDAYDGTKYYESGSQFSANGILSSSKNYQDLISTNNDPVMTIYPFLSESNALQLNNDSTRSKLVLAPNEAVVVPLNIRYKASESGIYKYISFDLRPSLFSDPVNYLIQFNVAPSDTVQQKNARSSRTRLLSRTMLENISTSTASTLQEQRAVEDASRYKTIIKNQ